MARKQYTLGGIQFATKKAALKHVGDIRKRYESNVGPVTDPSELAVLFDLVKFHPRYSLYQSIGILGFDTWIVIPYGGAGFRVVLADGTRDPFSYRTAFGLSNPRSHVLAAMRGAVASQVHAWKCNHWETNSSVRCAISGEVLTWEVFHVDHNYPWPFRRIVEMFFEVEKIDMLTVALRDGEYGVSKVLANPEFEARWSAFHAERATYRALHARENLKLSKAEDDESESSQSDGDSAPGRDRTCDTRG